MVSDLFYWFSVPGLNEGAESLSGRPLCVVSDSRSARSSLPLENPRDYSRGRAFDFFGRFLELVKPILMIGDFPNTVQDARIEIMPNRQQWCEILPEIKFLAGDTECASAFV
jgi:hypothetical protein